MNNKPTLYILWLVFRTYMIALPFLIAFCACGSEPGPGLQIINLSEYPDSFAESIIQATQDVSGVNIGLSGFTLTMTAHVGDSCGAPGEASACTNLQSQHIYSPFVSADSLPVAVRQSNLNVDAAGLLCHELGHIYFYQASGDGDPKHAHSEWYNYSQPGTICYAVSQVFNVEASPNYAIGFDASACAAAPRSSRPRLRPST